ncbi:hypothetical protein MKX01_005472 [Papaver californicum]|nr:hypothetical protein MKX01_005472 [Papaver californicum]
MVQSLIFLIVKEDVQGGCLLGGCSWSLRGNGVWHGEGPWHQRLDPVKCTQLDWERRYNIVGEIARGLLYLHEESRLNIIHPDLKASNILLGVDMNPKITDFSMARLFGLHQIQDSTNKIVATYGYMAPEYIRHGHISFFYFRLHL